MRTDEEQVRVTLEGCRLRKPGNETYSVLLEILNRNALVFTWDEQKGKAMRLWRTNHDPSLKDLIAGVENDIRAATLDLFLCDKVVFTTDLDNPPEVRWFAAKVFRHLDVKN